tara:strand:+ start:592 stop:855 length:264 start_codon:yes stop_codon:yes gene_type:complete
MCLFRSPKPTPPPPLPPAPPPPLPPAPPVDPPTPVKKEIDPQVLKSKKERAKKLGNNASKGTGQLKIKLNPKINKIGMAQGNSGGLN